ncbi:hypothetical protein V494_06192 [Pseudogymnoascus sp. VKM F-4513 (FW-928)]|nr:hypothetical protein V494_06192 [Pseudogymnoascus sp. VKM F-4513 (FW-928)]
MATDDASDSRTSSVGRKRTLQQSAGNAAEATAQSPTSDSDGGEPSGRASKRAKPNGNGGGENGTIPAVTDNSSSGAEAKQNAPVEKPKDATAAAISWNKGVQATVRTSLGGGAKAARKTAADNKPPASKKSQEEQSPIADDTPAPAPEGAQDKTKQVKLTRSEKRALASEAKKAGKPTDANSSGNSTPKSTDSNTTKSTMGHNLILPSPSVKRAKEKPAGYATRDLRTHFIYELLVRNSNVVGKIEPDSMVAACEAYMNKHYSKIEKKYGAVQLNDESFLGFCRNRLKEAKAGTLSTPKSVSTASSINGKSLGDVSAKDSAPATVAHGQSNDVEKSIVPNDRDQGGLPSSHGGVGKNAAPSLPESGEGDDYSPKLEPIYLPSSDLNGMGRLETDQVLSDAEAALINKYYPGLPIGTLRCLTCGCNGHLAATCPELKCSTCGVHGDHFTNSCPETVRCSKCHQRGHQKPACPEKLAVTESEGEACEICGSGHHMEHSCHFLWRSFKPDLGSVRKVRSLLADCYNCGADGHYGPECALSRSASLTARYTWSMANRDRYVDSKMSLPAISNGSYLPAKPQNGFSIKGSAKSNPVTLDDSDEEDFIRAKVAPPQPKGHIHFNAGRQQPDERYRPQPPAPSSYQEPPLSNSYRGNDDIFRFGDERPYSPPPSHNDYNQGRYDDQYHNFDHDRDYRSTGQPMMPFRGDNDGHKAGPTRRKRSRKGAGSETLRYDNVAPPQSLAGKKSGRGGRNKGGPRGGGRGGGASRGDLFHRPGRSSSEPRNVGAETMSDVAKMPETSIPPAPVVTRPSRPVSETLLNEKWDRCLSSLLIRSSLGLSFGVVFSVLIFKRRAWPAFVGLGFGAGRAYEECNSSFIRAGQRQPTRS